MKIRNPLKNSSRKVKAVSAVAGAVLAGGTAFAATNWTVGLSSGSNASAQGSSIQSLTISKVTTVPNLTDQLYPGGSGDVQFKLTNPNPFPVTVTSVTLPIESLTSNDAPGYSDATTSTPLSGCTASNSTVMWSGAGASQVTKTLSGNGFTVAGGNATITVTMTNDATMDPTAPLACAGTQTGTSPNYTYSGAYFVLPSLITVGATAGGSSPTANGGQVTTGY